MPPLTFKKVSLPPSCIFGIKKKKLYINFNNGFLRILLKTCNPFIYLINELFYSF